MNNNHSDKSLEIHRTVLNKQNTLRERASTTVNSDKNFKFDAD